MATIEAPVRRLTASERAALVARLHEGASHSAVADEFGISRWRVAKIAAGERDARRRAAEEEVARDLDLAALRVRWEVGLELVETVDVRERWQVFAAILWPSAELLDASRARALEGVEETDPRKRCAGCGTEIENCTADCRTCRDRLDGRRKRERNAAARRAAEGLAE